MSIHEVQWKVASDFADTMRTFGFRTFAEMSKCYWWTTKDIKQEVDSMLWDITDHDLYVDCVDGTWIMSVKSGDLAITYKAFMAGVYSIIRKIA